MVNKKPKSNRINVYPANEDLENSQAYWDKVLSDSGLSMERGRSPRIWIDRDTPNEHRIDVLEYVGTSKDLLDVEEEQEKIRSGKTQLDGDGPD
jgi:hypothetical protein